MLLDKDAAELSGVALAVDLGDDEAIGDRASLSARVTLLDGTTGVLPAVELALNPGVAAPAAQASAPSRARASGDAVRLLCVARSLDHGGSQLRLRELMQHLATLQFFKTTLISPADGPLRRDLEAAGVTVRIVPLPLDDVAAYERRLAELAAWAEGRFDIVLAATLTSFAGVDLAHRLGLPAVWRIGEAEPPRKVAQWLGTTLHPELEARARRAYGLASAVLFIRGIRCAFIADGRRPGAWPCSAPASISAAREIISNGTMARPAAASSASARMTACSSAPARCGR